ncbi:hypothetical protein Htur_5269 (plasmid) [Haloterrigena turkmenica DSM 5511]|uniref:Uncharacterized protein n=2 Tax=Haloterrigena turkmenica TaxID=62320 RepID=D2S3Q0_HALTV|nr:hypothetical protein Htur_5269 [Haloterrigena turkmenica DSM 5511]
MYYMEILNWIEKWSGILLRKLLAFSALLGVIVLIFTAAQGNAAGVISFALFVAPYLMVRYRDPESTTVPFQGRVF